MDCRLGSWLHRAASCQVSSVRRCPFPNLALPSLPPENVHCPTVPLRLGHLGHLPHADLKTQWDSGWREAGVCLSPKLQGSIRLAGKLSHNQILKSHALIVGEHVTPHQDVLE